MGVRAKSVQVRVSTELDDVIANLTAQQLSAPSPEHLLAFTAALTTVLGCQLAVRRAKNKAAVVQHLLILQKTLQGLDSVFHAYFGDADSCIKRASKITIH